MTPYVPALIIVAVLNLFFIHNNYGAGKSDGILSFIGNMLLLQDHSACHFAGMARINLPFWIYPYNSAEPFWTVAVEMWIYVAVGLFFFCMIRGEKIDNRIAVLLAMASMPVVIWNAAAGGGKSLTLIWIVGAIFGLLFRMWRSNLYANSTSIGALLIVVGVVALVGRVGKSSFDPYDFQTATLLAIVMFGIFAMVVGVEHISPRFAQISNSVAAYSYSLYLMHNTILILVLENVAIPDMRVKAVLAVVLAHVGAYLLYFFFERHYRAVGKWLRPSFERFFASPRRGVPVLPVLPSADGGMVKNVGTISPTIPTVQGDGR